MIETKVGKRYAKSLLNLSQDSGLLDAVNQDMQLFASVCDKNRDLVRLLRNPVVHGDKKLSILKAIFADKMNKMTLSFFEIVTRKGREAYLENIAKEFLSEYKLRKNIQTAEITSAVGLDDKLRAEVYKILRANTTSEVELLEKTDKNLIGGFILRIGDKQYDASVSSDLRKLAREFAENPYIRKN